MTIRNYINIHSRETFENIEIIVKPFSLFGKDLRGTIEAKAILYKKAREVGARQIKLTFFSLRRFAEKVDFNLEAKKISFGFDNCYCYDADLSVTFFIDDEDFFKISRSCN